MRVILDSNVLLVSLPKLSKYRIIFDEFLSNKLTLIISNEVITEYYEVISRFTNELVASNVSELLLVRPNVEKFDIYYNWSLITEDFDDNKFVDLAISSNSDYIVTNDKHFKILEEIEFPNVKVISLDDFLELLKSKK
ncbi:MAG: putative toxin-antitoxin system toxin component, PIN family [Bacteroidetes bacterium]|nr:putative toxin-antitoxin system toxin component, PIN family [Bacteroidota bacterium]